MDELKNQNPNGPDDSQNNNSYQGVDSFNQNMYQNNDPYASLNPDSQMNSPYGDINSNPYSDPYAGMTPNMDDNVSQGVVNSNQNTINNPQSDNSDDIDALMSNIPNGKESYANQPPVVNSNINDFDNQGAINPILSQNIKNDAQNVNNTMQDLNYPDQNAMQSNSFSNSNINYQNDMTYQGNGFSDPNVNYSQVNNGFEQNNQYNNFNQNSSNMNYQSENYSTDFTKAWMGTLYDKAHNRKFNWPAALFGGVYFLFRKMYLTGILFTLLTFLLNMIFMFLLTKIGLAALALAAVVNIAFVFVYGFSFYPLYRNFVQNKLNKMKQTITDNSQLISEAQKKGNTSVLALIIFFVVTPIIVSIILSALVTAGLISFSSSFMGSSNKPTNEISGTQEPSFDMKLYNFTDKYLVEYNSLTWFLDEENHSLTKGDYTLQFAQAISNVNESFNVDVTSPAGRSSLLSALVSSLEEQAAQLNLSVEAGLSNFAMGTNAYYGYVDVIDANTISRYYFILIPDNNILFQFVLTVNDTSIDYETNLEAINILTSAYEDPNYEAVDENDENQNVIENNVSNVLSNDILDENTISNSTDVANSISNNEISNETENISTNDVSSENSTTVGNATLSDILR